MQSCKDFFINYNKMLGQILKDNHFSEIEKITKFLIKAIKQKKRVFVCGNGGSASVANHFICDFNKGIKYSSKKKLIPQLISLTNSIELITAISNDIKFEEIFTSQLENYSKKNDVIIIISSSGKSKNILNVLKYATLKNLNIISLIGFGKNNYVKNASNYYINLNTKNYGLTEDIFQSIMHMISQYIRASNLKTRSEIL